METTEGPPLKLRGRPLGSRNVTNKQKVNKAAIRAARNLSCRNSRIRRGLREKAIKQEVQRLQQEVDRLKLELQILQLEKSKAQDRLLAEQWQ